MMYYVVNHDLYSYFINKISIFCIYSRQIKKPLAKSARGLKLYSKKGSGREFTQHNHFVRGSGVVIGLLNGDTHGFVGAN